jgi:hypothetical protein
MKGLLEGVKEYREGGGKGGGLVGTSNVSSGSDSSLLGIAHTYRSTSLSNMESILRVPSLMNGLWRSVLFTDTRVQTAGQWTCGKPVSLALDG